MSQETNMPPHCRIHAWHLLEKNSYLAEMWTRKWCNAGSICSSKRMLSPVVSKIYLSLTVQCYLKASSLVLAHMTSLWWVYEHCKNKEGLFWFKLVTSVSYLFCIIKYSGDPLPALHSKQWLDTYSRTLLNVMGEYFANETVQWCGKVWNWGYQNGSKLLIFPYSECMNSINSIVYRILLHCQ